MDGSRGRVSGSGEANPNFGHRVRSLYLRRSKHAWHTGRPELAMQNLILDTCNLEHAERHLCTQALLAAGNIVGAAKLLGLTRHSLKRRIRKLEIPWVRRGGQLLDEEETATPSRAA